MPFMCMAMAPPARKLWLPTCVWCCQFISRFKSLTALFTALFIWLTVTCLAGEDLVVKSLPIFLLMLLAWCALFVGWLPWLGSELCGAIPGVLFGCAYRFSGLKYWVWLLCNVCTGIVVTHCGWDVLLCHNATSSTRNCCLWRQSNCLWYVYLPTCSRKYNSMKAKLLTVCCSFECMLLTAR